uniref:Sodium channel protein n=1 Tax=Echeneis naucrates TaxID=173247 RepID=A0A665UI90_ECHNA
MTVDFLFLKTETLFSFFILLTILANCVFMTIPLPSEWSNTAEYVFIAIYMFEVLIKILSRGFAIGRFTFIRDPWNWLDLMVISTTILTEFVYLEKVRVVSTICRVLKIIPVFPGMKRTVGALIQSVRRLSEVIVVSGVVLIFLALMGQQIFMGSLRQKCLIWPLNLTDMPFSVIFKDASNYYYVPREMDALVCGNLSGWDCPEGYTCMRSLTNPNRGFTSFDGFGWSVLSVLRLLTQDGWEKLVLLMVKAEGRFYPIFVLLVFMSSFFIHGLIVSVVALVTVEQDKRDVAKAKQREEEFLHIKEVIKRREEEEEQVAQELCEEQHSAPQKKILSSVLKSHSSGELEDQKLCPPRCLRWNCCDCWRRLKWQFSAFVTNPFFDLGIAICIILNSFFISMEHYPMSPVYEEQLVIMNLVFVAIFTVEMLLRIVTMDLYGYFQEGWNVFDSVTVAISLLEISTADIEGFSALHIFRLMRMLRLARWWPTLHMLMKIMLISVRALRNMTVVLFVMVFLFTVVGRQLFGKDYEQCLCHIDVNSSWHMCDLFHTFVLVFRILCGEWIECLWDCMAVSGQASCLIFFAAVLVIGHLIVLNLFLSLLLSSATTDSLIALTEKRKDNAQKAVNQIKDFAAGTRTWILARIWTLCGKKKHINRVHKVDGSVKDNKEYLGLTFVTSEQSVSQIPENGEEEKKQQNEETLDTPEDCCCSSCYHCCHFLDLDPSQGKGRVWSICRRACFAIVQHKYFENFIIFIIVLSSAALVFEDIHLQQRPALLIVLDTADQVFTYLFFLEMLLKWMAFGLKKYFSSTWCWLDFLILAVTLISLTGNMLGYSELRTLRAVRPLRVLSRFQGIRVVLQTLSVTLPSMFDALLVVWFIWAIFSVVGVNLFAGKFHYCLNETSQEVNVHMDVNNKSECMSLIMENFSEVRWKSRRNNFDNVGAGFLSLLHVATFSGWIDIMDWAVDTTEVESQPVFENNLYMYLYFITFIIIGVFFPINFFIRVFINGLVQQRHKFGRKLVLQTEQQRSCWIVKRLTSGKDQNLVPRPQNKCQALLCDLVTKPSFEVFMNVVICLNMVALMVETIDMSALQEEILYWVHFTFIIIFFIEFLLKIIALRKHYFFYWLNIFDFIIITVSIVGIFLADIFEKYFISSSMLVVFRLFHISRIIHLIPCGQRIQSLLLAFGMSLPALFNICLLLFVFMFTFSIFGMFNFAFMKKEVDINSVLNFDTFVNSMMSLFTMTTMTGWDRLLYPQLIKIPDCDPLSENPGFFVRGDCGSGTLSIIFFASYITLSILLVFHMYLAVVLETFNMDNTEKLSDKDLQMFYDTWKKFDQDASQMIPYSKLSEFCDSLQNPLRIPKPNSIRLIQMDLSLLPGDQINCLDILQALTAQAFGESVEKNYLKDRMEQNFKTSNFSKVSEPISSTLRRRQEEVAAAVIQRAYRKHLQDRDGGVAAPEEGTAGV